MDSINKMMLKSKKKNTHTKPAFACAAERNAHPKLIYAFLLILPVSPLENAPNKTRRTQTNRCVKCKCTPLGLSP